MSASTDYTWGFYTGNEFNEHAHSVHFLVGFFFALNYMMGYGFLAVPYSVHYTGVAIGWVVILVISGLCCCTAWWILEVMARAQALEYWKTSRNPSRYLNPADIQPVNDSPAVSDGEDPSPGSSIRLKSPIPLYEIDNKRKFELTELCTLFLGTGGKVLYILVLSLQHLFSCWLYTTVAVTSWAINIPWNISDSAHVCRPSEFHDVILPARSECRLTYRFYILCFTFIIVPLSCIDFRKQKYFQIITTLLRFMAVLLMTSHAIFYFIKEEIPQSRTNNASTTSNESSISSQPTAGFNSLLVHKGTNWMFCIPVMVYAQTVHQAIPALCHVVDNQYSYKHLFTWVFVISGLLYCVFGTIVALAFGHETLANSALNWIPFMNSESLTERIIAYIIVIFPSIDVCSLFPLVTVTLGNNLYLVLEGRDTSVIELARGENNTKRKILYRVIICLTADLLAVFMANVLEIVKVCGIFSFLIVFVFPALLQYKSRQKCKRVFGRRDRRTEHASTIRGWYHGIPRKDSSHHKQSDSIRTSDTETPYSSIFSSSFCSMLVVCFGFTMLFLNAVTFIMNKSGIW